MDYHKRKRKSESETDYSKQKDKKKVRGDKQKYNNEFDKLEKEIRDFLKEKFDFADLQQKFQEKFLPMGYDIDKNPSLQIKRLRLQVIFLKLIAELDINSAEDKETLGKIEIICSMIESDIPEWSRIHKSPYIEVENEVQYIKYDKINIEEARYLFNKAHSFTTIIFNKYEFPNIFNKNDTEIITKGNKGNHLTYFISYTHLLALINKIKEIRGIKPKSSPPQKSTGGKIKIIKVIKKY